MLTMSVALLIIAILVGVFGFIAVGPAGLLMFAVFFGLFIWSVAHDRAGRSATQAGPEERDRPMQARRPGTAPRPGGRRHDDPPPQVPSAS